VADVRAFRGVRYRAEIARNLGNLIAPPYDVTTPHLIEDLRDRDPHNMVHLEHVEVAPGHDPHRHAAELYREWRDDGVLIRDERPALYLYDHWFTLDGKPIRRRGVMAAVRLAPWSERVVLPHEETFPGPKRERLRRLRAVQANLSPLYLLFRDPDHVVRELLGRASSRTPDETGIDPEGQRHVLTLIDNRDVIASVQAYFADQPLYVADGHHRYEAAVEYRDERAEAGFTCPAPAPDLEGAEQFVLALLCATDDPGVMVLPTHRLVRGVPDFDPATVRAKLGEFFDLEQISANASTDPGDAICLVKFAGETGLWRLSARPDNAHLALMPTDKSEVWRKLEVSILTSAVIQDTLGIRPEHALDKVSYTSSAAQALDAVASGEAQLAFLVAPSTVDDLMTIADAGDRMPPKSTYFWPKVPAGLVIHDLC
jgi:uncharacterized protein (DUF1015 family)